VDGRGQGVRGHPAAGRRVRAGQRAGPVRLRRPDRRAGRAAGGRRDRVGAAHPNPVHQRDPRAGPDHPPVPAVRRPGTGELPDRPPRARPVRRRRCGR
jgi:hypothetical protein